MMNIRSKMILAILVCLLAVTLGLVYYFFFTTRGLAFAASLLCRRLPAGSVTVVSIEGSLATGAVLRDVEVSEIEHAPGAVFRAQEVRVSFHGGWRFQVNNGRMEFPTAEVVSFNGTLDAGRLDLNVFAGQIYSQTLLRFLGMDPAFKGRIARMDLYFSGPLREMRVTGTMLLQEFDFRNFICRDFPLQVYCTLRPHSRASQITGRITADSGTLEASHARMEIKDASCEFTGDPAAPRFKVSGLASVKGTRIHALFTGTPSRIDIKLSSQPPLSQDRLMVMLLTGKSWEDTADALTEKRLTPGLIKDFADFFVFGGSVENLEKKLGITDLALTYQRGERGFEVHKSLTQSTGVIYGISRNERELEESGTRETRSFGLEYRFTGAFSVEGRRQFRDKLPGLETGTVRENVIRLKFKRSF